MKSFIFVMVVFVCLFDCSLLACSLLAGDMGLSTEPLTDGSADHPYLIEDFADFEVFCDSSDPLHTNYWKNLHVKLMCDLDLNPSIQGRQIYTSAVVLPDFSIGFKGYLDGNNHIISNITFNNLSLRGGQDIGLFHAIWEEASVINLGIENISVTGHYANIAGLVTVNDGTIKDCYVTGNFNCEENGTIGGIATLNNGEIARCYSTAIISGNSNIGGIAGDNTGTITDCYFTGSIVGSDHARYCGGVVSKNSGLIENSYSTASISGSSSLGGIAGENEGTITDCHTSGTMTPESDISSKMSDHVGGLVGHNKNFGKIINCYNTATLGGRQFRNVGGLVGVQNCYAGHQKEYGIINCYSTVDVRGDNGVGGLVGYVSSGIVKNSYCTGEVEGHSSVGGITSLNAGIIDNCYNTGKVTGIVRVGGLVGMNDAYYGYGTISSSFSTGEVIGGSWVGGFAGKNAGVIDNCNSTGKVTGNQGLLGGFVGENDSSSGYGMITKSFCTGDVFGSENSVGGFAGENNGQIGESFCTGNITSSGSSTGGFAGTNYGGIDNSYCKGNVTCSGFVGGGFVSASGTGSGNSKISNSFCKGSIGGSAGTLGGFCGYLSEAAIIESCFWDSSAGPELSDIGYNNVEHMSIVGMPTADLQTSDTFTNVGWDFVGEAANGSDDIWRMCVDGVEYPRLAWEFSAGDFVCGDGVNILDFAVIAETWGISEGETGYNAKCDLVDDGVIDVGDLALFLGGWLE